MTKPKDKENNGTPSLADMIQGINGLANIVQKQQKTIDSILGVLGVGNDGEQPDTEFGADAGLAEKDGAQDAQVPGGYPYKFGKDAAEMKLVELCFNTPSDKLPELTETPRMQVTPTSIVEAYNIYIDNMLSGKYEPLDTIFIRCRDRRMKSVQRRSLMEAMAFSQIQQEKKELEEGQQAGF